MLGEGRVVRGNALEEIPDLLAREVQVGDGVEEGEGRQDVAATNIAFGDTSADTTCSREKGQGEKGKESQTEAWIVS